MVRLIDRLRCSYALADRTSSGEYSQGIKVSSNVKDINITKSKDTTCASTLYSSSTTRSVHWGENRVIRYAEEEEDDEEEDDEEEDDERDMAPPLYIDSTLADDRRTDMEDYSQDSHTYEHRGEGVWYEVPTASTDSTTVSALSSPAGIYTMTNGNYPSGMNHRAYEEHVQMEEYDEMYHIPNGSYTGNNFPQDRNFSRRNYGTNMRNIQQSAKPQPTFAVDKCKLLYSLSKEKQEAGRRRREAIAQASDRRNRLPKPEDFGIIPASRATDLYKRGMRSLREKSLRITEEQKKKLDTESSTHDFKLARGAFACTPDPSISMSDSTRLSSSFSRNKTALRKSSKAGNEYDVTGDLASPRRKRLPLSRANDMYEKSIKRMHAKNQMVANHTVSNRRDDRVAKIPLSRASDMYNRSMKLAYKRQLKLEQISSRANEISTKTRSAHATQKKIPLSRASQLYNKASSNAEVTSKKIALARSRQNTPVREFGTIPKSRVTYMHEKGKRRLEAKQKKLDELRRQQDFEKILSSKIALSHRKRNKKALQLIHTKREEGTGIQNIEVRITDFDDGLY